MTYSSRLNAKLNPKHPTNQSFPGTPEGLTAWILERKADEELDRKIFGGLTKKQRKNLCKKCNIVMGATNICDFCE